MKLLIIARSTCQNATSVIKSNRSDYGLMSLIINHFCFFNTISMLDCFYSLIVFKFFLKFFFINKNNYRVYKIIIINLNNCLIIIIFLLTQTNIFSFANPSILLLLTLQFQSKNLSEINLLFIYSIQIILFSRKKAKQFLNV